MPKKENKTKKIIMYGGTFLLYAITMIALPFNWFMPLIIVPFIALGWASFVLYRFIKDYKTFKDDIAEDKEANWDTEAKEFDVTWEENPRDIEWKFETLAIGFFSLMYVLYIVIGFAMR